MKMNREELAWAAGLFEGDGCVTNHQGVNRPPRLQVSVAQSGDPFVLYRFQAAVGGLGNVNGPYPRHPHQPTWRFQTERFETSQAIVAMLWNWLSPPKREQTRLALLGMVK